MPLQATRSVRQSNVVAFPRPVVTTKGRPKASDFVRLAARYEQIDPVGVEVFTKWMQDRIMDVLSRKDA